MLTSGQLLKGSMLTRFNYLQAASHSCGQQNINTTLARHQGK